MKFDKYIKKHNNLNISKNYRGKYARKKKKKI